MNQPVISQGSIENMPLLDIATRNVISLAVDDCAGSAAQLMSERRISSILVTDAAGRPAGIVTERNILHAMQSGIGLDTVLRDIMSAPLVSVPTDITVLEAYRLCQEKNIRHLAIVDDVGALAGMVSETDFRLHLHLGALAGRRKIASVARRSGITLPPSATLSQALALMLAQHKSCVVVVEDRKPVGIITERDVVRFYSKHTTPGNMALGDVMTRPVLTIHGDAPASESAELMLASKVRHLVVVDDAGCMIGLLNEHDLTGMMTGGMEERGGLEANFLRLLVNTLPDLVWLKDKEGVYLACNARFEKFFGKKERDIVGKSDYDFMPREQAEFFREHDRKAMENDAPTVNEEWITFADDGHRELLETIKTPMRNRDGELIGVLGIARDITLRKRLEENLERSERKLHDIYDSVGDCIEIISGDGRILDMNRIGYERLGYTREEMVGRRLSEFAAPEQAGRIADRMAQIRRDGYATFESARLRKDGTVMPLEVRSRLIELDGQPVFLGISRDITERKEAEARLHDSHAKLSGLYTLSPMGIALTNMQGHYVEFNDAFREICGYTRDELNKLDYWELTPKEYAEQEAAQLESLNSKGYYGPYEKEYIRKDGSRIPLRLNGVLIHGSDGQPYIWSIVEDITERKRTEHELREKEERLALATLHNGVGVWDWNLVTQEMIWDDSMFALYHIRREDFLGTEEAWRRCLHPDDLERGDREVEEAIAGVKPFDTEFRVIWPNGDVRHIKAVAKVFRDEHGKPLRMLGTNVDITERKRMERQVWESEELFRTVFTHAPSAVELIDPDTLRFIEANPAACAMLGYTREEYLQLKLTDTQAEILDEAVLRVSIQNIEKLGGLTFENKHRCKNGDILLVEISARILNLSGKRLLVGVWRDITERKRADEAIRESENKYRSLFETAGDGIFLQNASGFIDCNEKGAAMYGLTRDEVIGRSPVTLAPERQPDGRKSSEVAGEMIAAAMNGQSCQFEWQALRADGSPLDVEINLNRIEYKGESCLQAVVRDISERKRAENALREREEIFSSIVNQAADSILLVDAETMRFVEFNRVAHESLGYSRDEFSRLTLGEVQAEYNPQQLHRILDDATASGRPLLIETQHKRKDGSIRPTQVSSRAIRIHGKSYFSSIWSDITERKREEENLRITASVFETTQEAILITDSNNFITDVNPAFTRITGYGREEVLGRNPKFLSSGRHDRNFYAEMWRAIKEKKSWRGEIWNRRKNGETYAELLSISAICGTDGKVQRHVGVFSDISYLKEHEAELSRVAHYDALTGIPNRVLLADRMKQAIAQTARERDMMAVCYLDLDGFKLVNDTLGHEAGDQVLVEIAQRIGRTIRGGDTVARLGGDEFVVLLLGMERGDECLATLERLLGVISQPLEIKGKPVTLGASIGVSIYPLDDENPDILLRHADQAMYVAKQSGKNRYHVYDPALDLRARSHYEFFHGIRNALESGQFELFYQPQLALESGRLTGAEALLRWRHAERGLLLPADFLPVVENTELGVAIGEWVIAEALGQLERWRREGLDIEVSINISAYHLESPDFVENLRRHLSLHPEVPHGRLQIEVVETAALKDIAVVRKLIEACRGLGVRFALDDFGTGYSSLSYLSNLPVDTLKIDQSFVRDMLDDSGDRAIVQGVIALARAFGRETVAEGIENDEQYRALLEMGCEIGQGYGIARPMPASQLSSWRRS